MLLLMFIIVFVISLITAIVTARRFYHIDWPSFTSAVIATISGLAIFTSICILIVNNVDKNGTIERMQIRHDMLVYQYENDIYNNDNDIGYRDLVVDIQDWNESLGYKKKNAE